LIRSSVPGTATTNVNSLIINYNPMCLQAVLANANPFPLYFPHALVTVKDFPSQLHDDDNIIYDSNRDMYTDNFRKPTKKRRVSA
jgi:hypothetical protein